MTYPSPSHRRRPGFTLIELLVVISIAVVLLGISFPIMRQMVRSSSTRVAADSVSNGVAAARAFATRYKPFTDRDSNGKTSEDDGDGYSGAAVIVTPANELRIVENFETAADGTARLELPPSGVFIRNGYSHIPDVDDLRIPGRATVLGIRRIETLSGNSLIELLPPPFAISFNRRGGMVVRDAAISGLFPNNSRSDGFVYYDSDGDGSFDTSSDRASASGVALSDFSRGVAPLITDSGPARVEDKREPMIGRRVMPFERFEPVVGVVVFVPNEVPRDVFADNVSSLPYDPDQVAAYRLDPADTSVKNLLEWASKPGNGEVLFFNRSTGADMNR
ncbi:MAG: prepilin-type N-terminal cleavage/methylation domain-containing protein [Planctomycetota bacterium]